MLPLTTRNVQVVLLINTLMLSQVLVFPAIQNFLTVNTVLKVFVSIVTGAINLISTIVQIASSLPRIVRFIKTQL